MKLLNLRVLKNVLIFIFVFIIIWLINQYVLPVEISGDFNAFKFVNNDLQSGEKIIVQINGSFEKEYIGRSSNFVGTIDIQGEKLDFSKNPLIFNSKGLADMNDETGHYGIMFMDNNMKNIVIEIHDQNGKSNGVYICIPSETRASSVTMAKKIMSRIFDEYTVD